jgi:aromatic ring-cleaving dioxygenase
MGENSVLVATHPEAEDDEEAPDDTQLWVGAPAEVTMR